MGADSNMTLLQQDSELTELTNKDDDESQTKKKKKKSKKQKKGTLDG